MPPASPIPSPTVSSRRQFLDQVIQWGREQDTVVAIAETGSKAFRRDDSLSDIDLHMHVKEGAVAATIGSFESMLALHFPIRERFRLPEPTWHGLRQNFYFFQDAQVPVLDLVLMEPGEVRYRAVERHGHAHWILTKDSITAQIRLDREQLEAKIALTLANSSPLFRLMCALTIKAHQREAWGDACSTYFRTVQLATEAIRMAECPERFDFGLRYLNVDLVPETYDRLVALLYPAAESIPQNLETLNLLVLEATQRVENRHGFLLQQAQPQDLGAINELILESKAHWPYQKDYLEACRAILPIELSLLSQAHCFTARCASHLVGFFSVTSPPCDDQQVELENFWLRPASIGKGLGRKLFAAARHVASRMQAKRMVIVSDVYAEGFYKHMGAHRIGQQRSQADPSLMLPLMELPIHDCPSLS